MCECKCSCSCEQNSQPSPTVMLAMIATFSLGFYLHNKGYTVEDLQSFFFWTWFALIVLSFILFVVSLDYSSRIGNLFYITTPFAFINFITWLVIKVMS